MLQCNRDKYILCLGLTCCLFLTGGHNLLEEHLIPASYLAVKDAVNNITVECYLTNQTPVLRADVFRY